VRIIIDLNNYKLHEYLLKRLDAYVDFDRAIEYIVGAYLDKVFLLPGSEHGNRLSWVPNHDIPIDVLSNALSLLERGKVIDWGLFKEQLDKLSYIYRVRILDGRTLIIYGKEYEHD
jgi:hypothetical protein